MEAFGIVPAAQRRLENGSGPFRRALQCLEIVRRRYCHSAVLHLEYEERVRNSSVGGCVGTVVVDFDMGDMRHELDEIQLCERIAQSCAELSRLLSVADRST